MGQNIWFGGCINYLEIEPLEQSQETEKDEKQTVSMVINNFVDFLQDQTQQEEGERTGTSAMINGLIDRLQNQPKEQQEETINETVNGLMLSCVGNTGVYRVCASTLIFFLLAALVV